MPKPFATANATQLTTAPLKETDKHSFRSVAIKPVAPSGELQHREPEEIGAAQEAQLPGRQSLLAGEHRRERGRHSSHE